MYRLNYFLHRLAAASLLSLGLASCQKEGVQPASSTASLAKTNLTVGPVPVIVWWSSVAPIPYSSGIQGDPPVSESSSVGFTINNKGYVLGGVLTTKSGLTIHVSDLWMFDPAKNAWSRQVPFPGNVQKLEDVTAFVIGDNAYVVVEHSLWQYNQPSNSWMKKSSFPSDPRIRAAAMTINGKGYFGLGFATGIAVDVDDWWQYDPGADQWTLMTTFMDVFRESGGSFVIGGKGYLCCGKRAGSAISDLWQYDPAANTWTQKQSLPGTGGVVVAADSASIGGIDLGLVAVDGDLWEYNPSTNSWGSNGILRESGASAGFVIGDSFFLAGISVATFDWSR